MHHTRGRKEAYPTWSSVRDLGPLVSTPMTWSSMVSRKHPILSESEGFNEKKQLYLI